MISSLKFTEISRKVSLAACAIVVALAPTLTRGETMDQKLQAAFEAGDLPGLHAVVVRLKGETVGEVYFDGEDERWGRSLGMVAHGPDVLHDVRSVTKSVVGLLYGIALSEGLVPALDAPLLAQFPAYADLADGSDREKITVRHALTMQMGTEWDESLPYTDPRNSEIAMELAEDRFRFALDRPMVDVPGTRWSYNGGALALIGKLIEDGTGRTLDDYAGEKLFAPLGVTQFEWVRGADGVASAASGLRLRAPDLATLGEMVASEGAYGGVQVVPAEWMAQSLVPAVTIQEGFHYGLLWYLSEARGGDVVAHAIGNGGQRLLVQPKADFVLAVLAGRYNDPEAWRLSIDILVNFALPEVRARALD